MDNDRRTWRALAETLQQWGMKEWAASLLEAAGPLSVVAAQIAHGVQPFVNQTSAAPYLEQLSRLLEEPDELKDFVQYLREAP